MMDSSNPESFASLIRVLSHQLKSPINSIESLLTVASEGYTGDIDSKTSHTLKKAILKTKEARAIITDLINYEKYAGTAEIGRQPIDIVAVLTALERNLYPAAAAKNISLTLSTSPDTEVMVEADKSGLELAIGNLIENAIKYTEQNGRVSVALLIDEKTKRCKVNVIDSGRGIAESDIDHIFEPFYRSSSLKASIAGTGLGLSITKRVAERHNGILSVHSKEGEGTTFSLELPYTQLRAQNRDTVARKRIVIIGGVTAGPKAAARLRRLDENLDITIIEKSEFLSYAGCGIPSYLSGKVKSPKALMSSADNTLRDVHFFETIKNIRVLHGIEATKIDRKKQLISVSDLANQTTFEVPYDILILSTGAQTVVPPIKGINSPGVYSLYKIEDAEAIKNRFADRPASDVYIIGGGLVGIETAESLMACGARVTILEKDSRILKLFDPDIAAKIERVLNHKGIQVLTGISISEIATEQNKHRIITDRGNFDADLIILSAGVRPNATLGKAAGLTIGTNGGIMVDRFLQTSDPQIYAIGDCAESMNLITGKQSYLPLGSISTKMGRIAADNICGRATEFPGSIGTTMFKIFDVEVGRTGLDEQTAIAAGFSPASVVIAGLDKAHYDTDARYIILKVVADTKTQRLLGAQAFGKGDASTRIAVLASALSQKMTLDDVFHLDLGYFPAFNNPIDLAQTACLVLKNKIEGLCVTITPEALELVKDTARIVDLSPLQDHEFNSIPGSINVPLENLRQEGIPFDHGDKIILYSKTSSRAFEAYRYLSAAGYTDMAILEGGFIYWKSW